jgi:hypothetical protein
LSGASCDHIGSNSGCGLLVVHVVGGRDGRQADAGRAATDRVDHGARGFEQQARAVLDGAAVVVGALVAAVFRNWSSR